MDETSPGEGTVANEEDKWDTGDVVNENLISGGDIGTLNFFMYVGIIN